MRTLQAKTLTMIAEAANRRHLEAVMVDTIQPNTGCVHIQHPDRFKTVAEVDFDFRNGEAMLTLRHRGKCVTPPELVLHPTWLRDHFDIEAFMLAMDRVMVGEALLAGAAAVPGQQMTSPMSARAV